MKLVTLVENTASRDDLIAQHGLSLYVEACGRKLLFDMGQNDTFLKNAQNLGIDLADVEIAVLSHGHYDHGGGLRSFLEINKKAAVYLHTAAFGAYYNGMEKYIGLDQSLQREERLRFTEGTVNLLPGMVLTDCAGLGWKSDPWGLNQKIGDGFVPDTFSHEQYLLITEGEKRVLISGCSHKGIMSIAGHFQPDVLVGGFHLNKEEDETRLREIGKQLLEGAAQYYTGHCTGENQYQVLKSVMGDRLQRISTGTVITI